MTAVPIAVTDAVPAPAPAVDAQQTGPGFALYVGIDETRGLAGRVELAQLAQAVNRLVEQIAPSATVHSALALGTRGPQRETVARMGMNLAAATSAAARARLAWTAPGAAVVVDAEAREVTRHGRPVALTKKEFALLEYLLRAAHRAVPREELLRTVWRKGVSKDGTRTIDVHVRRLREKLGGCPQIVTVRGVGYRCDPTPEVVLVGSGDAG